MTKKRKAASDSQRVKAKQKKTNYHYAPTPKQRVTKTTTQPLSTKNDRYAKRSDNEKVTNTTTNAVSTNNRYAKLSDDEEEIVAVEPTPTKKVKTPPIVVIDANYMAIKTLMDGIKVQNYNLKYISMGIKILCNTLDDYNASIRGLKEAKIEFYSHDIPSLQPMKFVLSGLPDLAVDEVKTGLQMANIQFVDVKKMHTKGDHKNYALYLVYFANKSTKLSELKVNKYVLNIVVSWSPYIASRKGPTQCNNCQLHGHGSKNCNLPPRCSKCGGKHESRACLRDQLPLPEQLYVCCLCGNAHSSRDRNCPKRIDYIKMKLSHSSSKSNHASKSNHSVDQRSRQHMTHQQPSTNNNSEFPSIKVHQGRKFSDWFSPSQPNSPAIEANRNASEELFSPQQLLELTTELISNLKVCRTKMDQFQVITKLAIKYVTNYD